MDIIYLSKHSSGTYAAGDEHKTTLHNSNCLYLSEQHILSDGTNPLKAQMSNKTNSQHGLPSPAKESLQSKGSANILQLHYTTLCHHNRSNTWVATMV